MSTEPTPAGARPPPARRAHALFVALVAATACGPSEREREARRVLDRIDELRRLDVGSRGPALDALEREAPSGPEAERARTRCSRAYRLLDEARALTDRALAASDRGEPAASWAGAVDAAARTAHDAEDAVASCAQAAAALRGVVVAGPR